MIVQCDQCATKYTVPDEKIPAAGIKAQCKGCGHIMAVSRPAAQAVVDEPPVSYDDEEEAWSCPCGAGNAPDVNECGDCGQPKAGLLDVEVGPEYSGVEELGTAKGQARSVPLVPWRRLLLVGAVAVVIGVGTSFVLGQMLNRSLSTFLTAIFK